MTNLMKSGHGENRSGGDITKWWDY